MVARESVYRRSTARVRVAAARPAARVVSVLSRLSCLQRVQPSYEQAEVSAAFRLSVRPSVRPSVLSFQSELVTRKGSREFIFGIHVHNGIKS